MRCAKCAHEPRMMEAIDQAFDTFRRLTALFSDGARVWADARKDIGEATAKDEEEARAWKSLEMGVPVIANLLGAMADKFKSLPADGREGFEFLWRSTK